MKSGVTNSELEVRSQELGIRRSREDMGEVEELVGGKRVKRRRSYEKEIRGFLRSKEVIGVRRKRS